jgi:periplasmic protein TonB
VVNVSDKSQEGAKVEVTTTYTGGDDKGKVVEAPKEEPKQEEDKIYNKVEIEAKFQGSFRDFLEKNLRYPSDAQEAGQSGVVVIEFVVDREGKISDPHVADNSPVKVPSLVDEAIRIIKKSSGKWSAGIQNGTPVRSYHQQSINFVLAEEEG